MTLVISHDSSCGAILERVHQHHFKVTPQYPSWLASAGKLPDGRLGCVSPLTLTAPLQGQIIRHKTTEVHLFVYLLMCDLLQSIGTDAHLHSTSAEQNNLCVRK